MPKKSRDNVMSSSSKSSDEVNEEAQYQIVPPNDRSVLKGIQTGLSGILYQIKLTLYFGLYFWKELKNNFCIDSEDERAGKLDDIIVYKQTAQNEEIKVSFYQIKHSEKGATIGYENVLKDVNASENRYSIPKYFVSWRQIKNNPAFKNYTMDGCYLFTNCKINNTLERVTTTVPNADQLFRHKSGKLLKVDITKDISRLREMLKRLTDFNVLVNTVFDHVKSPEELNEKNPILATYHLALLKEKILTNNASKFHDDFIMNNDDLSHTAKRFRNEYFNLCKGASPEMEDNEIVKHYLENVEFIKSDSFGVPFEKTAVENFDYDKFATELSNLILSNKNNYSCIPYNANDIGKTVGKKNIIHQLSGHVFVFAETKNRLMFTKSFFDDSFATDINDISLHKIQNKKATLDNLIQFKTCLKKEIKKKESFNNLSKCRFAINPTLKYTSHFEIKPKMELPQSDEENADSEIDQFLNDFYLAVTQPNEAQFTKIIDKKVGEMMNLSNPKHVTSNMIIETANWIKMQNHGYLNGTKISEFVEDAKGIENENGLILPTNQYCKKLQEYGNYHVISSLTKEKKQILWLLADNPISLATLVEPTLETENEFLQQGDFYIFNTLSFFGRVFEEVVPSFKKSVNIKTLVIVDEDNDENPIEEQILHEFSKMLADVIIEDETKKLVIIANDKSYFAKCIKENTDLDIQIERTYFDEHNKDDNKKIVSLQGQEILVYDIITSFNSEILPGPYLVQKLMSYQKISIGKPLAGNIGKSRSATYTHGKINIIEMNSRPTLLKKGKAIERKTEFPSYWIASFILKKEHFCGDYAKGNFINDHLPKCIEMQYKSPSEFDKMVFEYLCKHQHIILIIDAYDLAQTNVQYAATYLHQWESQVKEIWIMAKQQFSKQLYDVLKNIEVPIPEDQQLTEMSSNEESESSVTRKKSDTSRKTII